MSRPPIGHKRQSSQSMKKLLKEWVRACVTRPPYNITITNLSKSFGDGKAFSALVHSLSTVVLKKEPYSWQKIQTQTPLQRMTLAFNTAQRVLRVDSLLDADDTVGYQDQKSECNEYL